ncbi:MAG: hypothetical protein AAGD43_18830 [Pseudomonadota bacterium]
MSTVNPGSFDATLQNLFAERQAYVKRIADLGSDPQCAQEVDGYLRLIDSVNSALRTLANGVPHPHGV